MQKNNSGQKNNLKTIDVWGDGDKTRSFLFIDDCIKGTLNVFNYQNTIYLMLEAMNRFQLIK